MSAALPRGSRSPSSRNARCQSPPIRRAAAGWARGERWPRRCAGWFRRAAARRSGSGRPPTGESASESTHPVSRSGACWFARYQPRTADPATSSMTTAVCRADSVKASRMAVKPTVPVPGDSHQQREQHRDCRRFGGGEPAEEDAAEDHGRDEQRPGGGPGGGDGPATSERAPSPRTRPGGRASGSPP